MNTTELINILDTLNDFIYNTEILKKDKKEKYSETILELKKEYLKINIDEENKELKRVYKSLIKNGNKLLKEIKANKNSKEMKEKINYYIGYLKAAKADFTGNTNIIIGKYYRVYILTSALFFALSPQYYGFILPALLFVPIFLGIKGIKNRSKTGFHFSLSVVPVALMTSFTWIRYGIYALSNFNTALNETVNSTGLSPFKSKLLVTVPPLLALILLISVAVMAYRGYKSKDLFL